MTEASKERRQILVAGIGNIFLGDDAFGVEVAQRLARRPQPAGVRVVDFGIRGLDLAYELLNGYEAVILLDAMPRGGRAGELYLLEPDVSEGVASSEAGAVLETHNVDPVRVLQMVFALGGEVKHLLIVGCEPRSCEDDGSMEMSAPVRKAVEEAVPLIESLIGRWLRGMDRKKPARA